MDPRDYDNLEFILSIAASDVSAWWEAIDDLDRAYASSLIQCYSMELAEAVQPVDDVSIAKNYLEKFML